MMARCMHENFDFTVRYFSVFLQFSVSKSVSIVIFTVIDHFDSFCIRYTEIMQKLQRNSYLIAI